MLWSLFPLYCDVVLRLWYLWICGFQDLCDQEWCKGLAINNPPWLKLKQCLIQGCCLNGNKIILPVTMQRPQRLSNTIWQFSNLWCCSLIKFFDLKCFIHLFSTDFSWLMICSRWAPLTSPGKLKLLAKCLNWWAAWGKECMQSAPALN